MGSGKVPVERRNRRQQWEQRKGGMYEKMMKNGWAVKRERMKRFRIGLEVTLNVHL